MKFSRVRSNQRALPDSLLRQSCPSEPQILLSFQERIQGFPDQFTVQIFGVEQHQCSCRINGFAD